MDIYDRQTSRCVFDLRVEHVSKLSSADAKHSGSGSGGSVQLHVSRVKRPNAHGDWSVSFEIEREAQLVMPDGSDAPVESLESRVAWAVDIAYTTQLLTNVIRGAI